MSRLYQFELGSASMASLLDEYALVTTLYGEALEQGDSERANQSHAEASRIYRELRSRGREAQLQLLGLLDHPNPSVRCWAAVHTLEVASEQAEPVLAEIASKGPVPLCLSAEILLSEWRRGTLQIS
jgi:hypothetical protein